MRFLKSSKKGNRYLDSLHYGVGATRLQLAASEGDYARLSAILAEAHGRAIIEHTGLERGLFRGKTPLFIATESLGSNPGGVTNSLRCIRALIAAGADASPDAAGEGLLSVILHDVPTPLVDICAAIARRFIAQGQDVNYRSNKGERPLHRACASGRRAYVSLLLDAGAEPNVVDNFGAPPLLTAFKHRFFDCSAVMLAAGADAEFKLDRRDSTSPLEWLLMDIGERYTQAGHRALETLMRYGAGVDIDEAGRVHLRPDTVAFCEQAWASDALPLMQAIAHEMTAANTLASAPAGPGAPTL